ncbi:hypothetical protein V5O48_014406 [Marasmius crinis-equi]|uniref:Uncharacterized protein n=1 Tax=Marasmius crinis-equi TaxID=585013 RepID=A0ABR3EXE0_9AGAR
MSQFTDQEIVAMAEDRGFVVLKPCDGSSNASAAAAPSPTPSPKKVTQAPSTASSNAGAIKTAASTRAASTTSRKAGVNKTTVSTTDEEESNDDQNLSKLLRSIAAKGNVTFSLAGKLSWNLFAKDCWNRGIQIFNYPKGVTLPWNMPDCQKIRKKGVKGLTKDEQKRLHQACVSRTHPLEIRKVDVLQVQTDAIPIAIVLDENGQTEEIFASSVRELADLAASKASAPKGIKAECQDQLEAPTTAEPSSVFSDTHPAREARSNSRGRTVRFAEGEDELEEDDIYGIGSTDMDDEDYNGSPSKQKRKHAVKVNKGKGKAKAPSDEEEATPRASSSGKADTTSYASAKRKPSFEAPPTPTPSSKRAKPSPPPTQAQLGTIAGNPRHDAPLNKKPISSAEFSAGLFQPIPMSVSQEGSSGSTSSALPSIGYLPSTAASSSGMLLGNGAAGRPGARPVHQGTATATPPVLTAAATSPVPTAPSAPAMNTTRPSFPAPVPHVPHAQYPQPQYPHAPPANLEQPGAQPISGQPDPLAGVLSNLDPVQLRRLLLAGLQSQATQSSLHQGATSGGWGMPQAVPGGFGGDMSAQEGTNGQSSTVQYGGMGPGGSSGYSAMPGDRSV